MSDPASEPARTPARTIAFQGAPGAYSDLACRQVFPAMATLPCGGFDDAMAAVRDGQAALVDTIPLGVDTPAELARAREALASRS